VPVACQPQSRFHLCVPCKKSRYLHGTWLVVFETFALELATNAENSCFGIGVGLHVNCIWVACQLLMNCIWVACQLLVNFVWVACRLHLSWLSVAYELHLSCLQVDFELIMGCDWVGCGLVIAKRRGDPFTHILVNYPFVAFRTALFPWGNLCVPHFLNVPCILEHSLGHIHKA